jgi:uncharacterized protein (AIM24 family)
VSQNTIPVEIDRDGFFNLFTSGNGIKILQTSGPPGEFAGPPGEFAVEFAPKSRYNIAERRSVS